MSGVSLLVGKQEFLRVHRPPLFSLLHFGMHSVNWLLQRIEKAKITLPCHFQMKKIVGRDARASRHGFSTTGHNSMQFFLTAIGDIAVQGIGMSRRQDDKTSTEF